jgi:hypothetical protein
MTSNKEDLPMIWKNAKNPADKNMFPPLARLVPIAAAAERLVKPFALKTDWEEKRGWFQWLVNQDSGQKWDVGKQYDFEGYVDVLNADIQRGKFSSH